MANDTIVVMRSLGKRSLLLFLALTLVCAPLLCVWFCRIRHAVAQPQAVLDVAVHGHASDLIAWVAEFNAQHVGHAQATLHYAEDVPQPASSGSHPQPHRPSDDMSQVMLAVTELVVSLMLLHVVLSSMGRVLTLRPSRERIHTRRCTPPPRLRHA